jgi:hypothetical protein
MGGGGVTAVDYKNTIKNRLNLHIKKYSRDYMHIVQKLLKKLGTSILL